MNSNINDFLTHFVIDLNRRYEASIRDLSDSQLRFQLNERTNHIAFIGWHALRSQDNVINYFCQSRKATLWLRQDLNVKWGLPRAAQGTDMDSREARALEVPSAAALAQYAHDLAEDVTPYLETVDGLTLRASIRVGEKERSAIQLIGQSVLAHGNVHLGQILTVRAAQGLRVDAY